MILSQGWAGRWDVGRQPWVGSTALPSLRDRQPSEWYVSVHAAAPRANVRGFKFAGADAGLLIGQLSGNPTHPHHSYSHYHPLFPIFTSLREVKPTEQKQECVSSAWSGLISVLFVSVFPCFPLLTGSKMVFLSSLTSHNTLPSYQWELMLFPAFSTTAAIFPMLSFQRTYLGHQGYQTSGEWTNILREVKRKKVISMAQITSQYNHTIVCNCTQGLCISRYKNNFLPTQLSFSVTTYWSVTWCCFLCFQRQWANQKAEILYLQLPLWPVCWGQRSRPEANTQPAI